MLYQPQYRQCRADIDLNKDMDILDFLCQQCPAGQCVSGFDPATAAPTCVPCGCSGGSCTPTTCDPNANQALVAVDGGCGFTCGTLPSGGGCTGSLTKPLEQRAVRTTTGTCADNWLPFCDVRNYGAVGGADPNTNNAAFAAAISACCAGGTVYVPRDPNQYEVTRGFNSDETCFYNLLGDGTFASRVLLRTALGNCVGDPNAPPYNCDPLFDVSGGWVQDMTFTGPGTAGSHPGSDTASADAIHFPGDVTRVTVDKFTTALEFPGVIRESLIEDSYLGAHQPSEIHSSSFSNDFYAHAFFDGATTGFTSRKSSYSGAPYLWLFHSNVNNLLSVGDTFANFGNAGILHTSAVSAAIDVHIDMGSNGISSTPGAKIATRAVDKAIHLGLVSGLVWIRSDNGNFTSGNCQIDTLNGTGSYARFISTAGSTQSLPTTTCTISAGSQSRVAFCNLNETQCVPLGLATLTPAAFLLTPEMAPVYLVQGGGTNIQQFGPNNSTTCSQFAGQQYVLVFTGSATVDDRAVSTGCEIALNGTGSRAAGSTLTIVHDGTRWREIARSDPNS